MAIGSARKPIHRCQHLGNGQIREFGVASGSSWKTWALRLMAKIMLLLPS